MLLCVIKIVGDIWYFYWILFYTFQQIMISKQYNIKNAKKKIWIDYLNIIIQNVTTFFCQDNTFLLYIS